MLTRTVKQYFEKYVNRGELWPGYGEGWAAGARLKSAKRPNKPVILSAAPWRKVEARRAVEGPHTAARLRAMLQDPDAECQQAAAAVLKRFGFSPGKESGDANSLPTR